VVMPAHRPTPIREAARLWSLAVGGIGAVASFLLTSQVISAGQADSVTAAFTAADVLISAVVGLITAGSAVLAAFRTASTSEPKVTPISSPAIAGPDGQLIPLVRQPVHGGGE
jgi:hypothetical protein